MFGVKQESVNKSEHVYAFAGPVAHNKSISMQHCETSTVTEVRCMWWCLIFLAPSLEGLLRIREINKHYSAKKKKKGATLRLTVSSIKSGVR